MLICTKLRIQGIKYFCLILFSRFRKEMQYFLIDQNDDDNDGFLRIRLN